MTALRQDLASIYIVECTPEITKLTWELLLRYALRAGDAIQLASCVQLQRYLKRPVQFLGYDLRLNAAARNEGLEV